MTDYCIEVSVPNTTDIAAAADLVDLTADPTGATVVVVAAPGPPGPQGPAGTPGNGGITHTRSEPAATWIVPNTLGRLPQSVTVWIDGQEVTTDVFADLSTITITFAAPAAGRAEII